MAKCNGRSRIDQDSGGIAGDQRFQDSIVENAITAGPQEKIAPLRPETGDFFQRRGSFFSRADDGLQPAPGP